MKNISIKVKITMWYLLLMTIMVVMVLAFILAVSSSVTTQTAMSRISSTVRSNLTQVSSSNGKIFLGEDFHFYQNGVYTLIYSKNEALLAGQVPVNFTQNEPFENGLTRTVSTEDDNYYVFDLWLPFDWENGVWVRGLMEVPEDELIIKNLILVVAVAMPAFILFATIGGYWIAKKAFKPLEDIISTADSINEASDLSARIDVPSGSNEFTRLAKTFDQMFTRLEQSFEAEKQFTSDASHELRTPISVIKGACEYALKYDETPEERQETLSMIHRQAVKMSGLVAQLLSMTRLEQGTEKANFEKINLTELTKAICTEQAYADRNVYFEAKNEISAFVDTTLITRLIQNLIDNAVKYGKTDGHVWVTLTENEHEIQLTVKDDGIGIPKEEQSKIWQRFYQVDASRTGDNGTGLGLSMVQKIAEIHGGYMSLESEPLKGSNFVLHLPKNNY